LLMQGEKEMNPDTEIMIKILARLVSNLVRKGVLTVEEVREIIGISPQDFEKAFTEWREKGK